MYSQILKIFIRGASQVGKTSFIGRFFEGYRFDLNHYTSIDFRSKQINYNNLIIRLLPYEMQGQRYVIDHPIDTNYRRANGIILLFDITSKSSFLALKNEIENNIKPALCEKNHPVIYVIGNKNDLEINREVSKEEAKKFSDEYGYKYFECSLVNYIDDVNHIMGILTMDMFNQKLLDEEKKPIFTKKEIKINKKCIIF